MNKYKSRSDVPDKYKWDLTDFFKNEEEFDEELKILKSEIEKTKDFVGCTRDSDKLVKYLRYYIEISNRLENLYIYSYLKSDEELGISKNIDRKNKAEIVYSTFGNYNSFFEPELISLSKDEYDKLFDNKELLEYKFLLDEIFKNKDHILNEKEEKIINNVIEYFLLTNKSEYKIEQLDAKIEITKGLLQSNLGEEYNDHILYMISNIYQEIIKNSTHPFYSDIKTIVENTFM